MATVSAEENNQNSNEPSNKVKGSGTRVFKKASPNSKVTCYIGKRDFVDHVNHIDPVDGVVLVDPEYVGPNNKVFVHILAAFRYGREDLDVLGLTFRKDLFLASEQVYPPPDKEQVPLTRLQERLLKKLGKDAYPFIFELPPGSPSSVTLQPAPGDTGKPCGVDYELKTFVAPSLEEKPHKRDCVRLAIRKITYAPEQPQPQPFVEAEKVFMMSQHPLHIEASLDKGLYYHGESIAVNIHITNRSSRSVKKIRITVRQHADICLFSTAQYKCPVATLDSEEGFPIGPSCNLSKVYSLTPLLSNNKDKRGLALDGKLKHEDTNLASSTILESDVSKENLGIIVQYKVKIRLIVAYGGDLAVELPFMLTHPKPEEPESAPSQPPRDKAKEREENNSDQAVDHNLIDFDTNGVEKQDDDDDLIFEDFARMRLKGEHGDTTEA
ncbi:beta-arrestin-1-like [Xenia sp. Carnegie-2017]|uniref:beta-arrestin-1-like n=1 Tax=Xenia sp. Carnegie-2017 TaxID=2897299 RepID=UPI001F04083E|nr:beta-arrestin-1-like [Xenia sp. Carnegie-2017]